MTIIAKADKRVIVQGITGREGLSRTRLMLDYGTRIVGGVTPGKGGQLAEGVPVFDSVRQAVAELGEIDTSVLFIPAPLVRNAALEAIDAGVKTLIIVPDRVPVYDVLEIDYAARQNGARFLGPNTLGVLSPEHAVLGMMGGRAAALREWAFTGPVGISSRSGGISTSMAYYLAQAGIGTSTVVHVGGDSIVGMPHAQVLKQFERDSDTRLVVMFGEIGTSQEEDVADLIAQGLFTKPLIAYIGGKAAKEGTRFSHAGAIIEGGRGTYEGKVEKLRDSGVHIAEAFADIPKIAAHVLANLPQKETQKPDSVTDQSWYTAITEIKPNSIRLRGHKIDELMGEIKFSQGIFLALTGRLPEPRIAPLIDALFVSSIDHGTMPPSTLAARTATSTGAPLNAALSAGLLSINAFHGGAIEDCMHMITDVQNRVQSGQTLADATQKLIVEYRANGKKLSGLGHRLHTADPRTRQLFALATECQVSGAGVATINALREAFTQITGKTLPINVDGALAGILYDLEIPAQLGNAFFMIARVPGLIAHITEERQREKPMRVIYPRSSIYDGEMAE
ncbi:MAG: citryl-CoA lyase [Aggregatilineales bacterium]